MAIYKIKLLMDDSNILRISKNLLPKNFLMKWMYFEIIKIRYKTHFECLYIENHLFHDM